MAQEYHHALSVGTRIEEFEIRGVLGAGGFGITYKGYDHDFLYDVAIKEYLPMDLALRAGDEVRPVSDREQKDYEYGLTRFLNEARTLAKFKNEPNIVRVIRFLKGNGTAYLVMDYEEGESFDELLKRRDSPLEEDEVRRLIIPIMKGLRTVHASKFLHRDIKPANIYLRKDGEPVLLDFGSARHALGDRTRSMTSIVTRGYAPFEQYHTRSKQGPWTDLYALGATMYRCITGMVPVESPERIAALQEREPDPLVRAEELGKGSASPEFLQMIDWMLRPRAKERPQSVGEVLRRLEGAARPSKDDGERRRKEEQARLKELKRQEEAARLKAEDAQRVRQDEEKRWSQEEAARLKAEEEERLRKEEEARLKELKRQEEEARRKAAEAERKRAAEEERRRKEEQARLKAEEAEHKRAEKEERRRKEEQARLKAEEAARRAEIARQRAAEKEAKLQERQREREAAARKKAELKEQRQEEREAATRKKAELREQRQQERARKREEAVRHKAKAREQSAAKGDRRPLPAFAAGAALAAVGLVIAVVWVFHERSHVPGVPVESPVKPIVKPRVAPVKPPVVPVKWKQGELIRDSLKDGTKGPEMVVIAVGSYRIGYLRDGRERDANPARTVVLEQPLALGKYEVTFSEYDRFAKATGRPLPEDRWGRGDQPAIRVSWTDAAAYAAWLSGQTGERYRLPTEIEWEIAARGKSESKFWWGDKAGNGRANCLDCGKTTSRQTVAVASFKANPAGLHNVAGNVWEWVRDCWTDVARTSPEAPGKKCTRRVMRGGSWFNTAEFLRPAYRLGHDADTQADAVGFRLARELAR